AVLVAEVQAGELRVLLGRVAERDDVDAETAGDREPAADAPLILHVGAHKVHFERLDRLLLARDVVVADLEATRTRAGRRRRVRGAGQGRRTGTAGIHERARIGIEV